jgi:hypothetical protein
MRRLPTLNVAEESNYFVSRSLSEKDLARPIKIYLPSAEDKLKTILN